MNYDEQFFKFLKILFSYQYTNKHISPTGEIAQTIFKLSNGIPAIIVSLFVETQRNAILNDEDCVSSQSFTTTFKLYFANLLPFINQSEFVKQRCKHNKGNDEIIKKQFDSNDDLFKEVSLLAKKDLNIAIDYLQKYISVEFV